MQYWDTSAIFKLYFPELDTPWFIARLRDSTEPALTSEFTAVELYCTLLRKEREESLNQGEARKRFLRFQDLCTSGAMVLVACDKNVFRESLQAADLAYAQPNPILIRSLDLIHVAAALEARATTIVTTDKRLRELATALKIAVVPEGQ